MLAVVRHSGTNRTSRSAVSSHAAAAEVFPEDDEALRYHITRRRPAHVRGGDRGQLQVTDELYFGDSLAFENIVPAAPLRARHRARRRPRSGARHRRATAAARRAASRIPLATEHYDVDVNTRSRRRANVALEHRRRRASSSKDVWLGVAYHTPPGLAIQNELDRHDATSTRAPRDGGGLLTGARDGVPAAARERRRRAARAAARAISISTSALRWEDLSRLQAYDVRGYGSQFAGRRAFPSGCRGRAGSTIRSRCGRASSRSTPRRARSASAGGSASRPLGARRSHLAADDRSAVAHARYRCAAAARRPSWSSQGTYGLQYFPTRARHQERVRSARRSSRA